MHSYIASISILIGFAGYVPYLRDLYLGKTKPHLFSWIIWMVLEYTAFAIQIQNGAGAGAWVTFFSALVATVVVGYAFHYRSRIITGIDWLCLCGALATLALWLLCHAPVLAAILLSITDALAFIPTFRKTWHAPHDETLFEYEMAALKFIVAFFAFNRFTLANTIYPAYLVVANAGFAVYAIYRRGKIAK